MPRYIIEEKMPCWVTWRRVVDAKDAAAAVEAFNEGAGERVEGYPEIGDLLDSYDIEQVIVSESNEPIGAITPEGERLDQWDERLRAAGCIPIYPGDE